MLIREGWDSRRFQQLEFIRAKWSKEAWGMVWVCPMSNDNKKCSKAPWSNFVLVNSTWICLWQPKLLFFNKPQKLVCRSQVLLEPVHWLPSVNSNNRNLHACLRCTQLSANDRIFKPRNSPRHPQHFLWCPLQSCNTTLAFSSIKLLWPFKNKVQGLVFIELSEGAVWVIRTPITYLDGDLREVVRVPKSRCDVEFEIMRIFNQILTKTKVLLTKTRFTDLHKTYKV